MKFQQNETTEIEIIDQKFLVSGHSFLPNDSDFGSVELAAKGKTIYLPQQWHDIMTACRRKKKIVVCQMSSNETISTENLEKNITQKRPVNWLKIQCMRLEIGFPFEIKYKESLQEMMDFQTLDITPSQKKGRPMMSLKSLPQDLLYQSKRPVSVFSYNLYRQSTMIFLII